jgi:prolyl-tRNA synthetase
MAKWTQSYRDLPLLLNQWVNVVRWELRPRLFLRTSEFLWQEGHTAHATQAEATEYARRIHLDVYRDFMENELALPVFIGLKTDRERFAGAINTLTCEAIMGDGKALQVATSHELGQNFARAFDIDFLGQDGDRHLAWTTSWGSSTRIVGALIMAHGDDAGLRVPPRLAPIQAVVLAVRDAPDLVTQAKLIHEELERHGVRSTVDTSSASFGRRVTGWELKGVPVRIEVGPRDLAEGKGTVVRCDTRSKMAVARSALAGTVTSLLEDIQASLYQQALKFRTESTHDVTSVDAAIEVARTGVARLPWQVVGEDGETRLAEEALTVRCIQRADGSLPSSVLEPDLTCIVARAY